MNLQEYKERVQRVQENTKVVQRAAQDAVEYLRLVRQHPEHCRRTFACQEAEKLSEILGRSLSEDMQDVSRVEEVLRALPEGDPARRNMRVYLKSVRVCRENCKTDIRLHVLAEQLGRNLETDLKDTAPMSHWVADLRSLNNSMKQTGTHVWFGLRDRWNPVHKTLRLYGWVAEKK